MPTCEQPPRHPETPLDSLQWWQARKLAQGEESCEAAGGDDWKQERAEKIAAGLAKQFGDSLKKQPEVLAMALAIYSPPLADALIDWLTATEESDDIDDVDDF